MKRSTLLIIIMCICAVAAMAGSKNETPAVTFDTERMDFGTVRADGGMVEMQFPFTVTSSSPVSIVMVTNGGCGCTKPSYTTEPLRPGEKSAITVHFNPAEFKGEVNRQIRVKFSSGKKTYTLKFTGVIIPK